MKRLVLVAGICAIGCGGGGTSPTAPATIPSPAVQTILPDAAFDPGRLHDVRITMDPVDWAALCANYRENTYYAARIAIDGRTFEQVGVRSRGEASRSGTKPALKVDFDRWLPDQQLGVYRSLVVDNQLQDPSFLRERLAFRVFEAMGIPAPANAFARVTVNGAYAGLYSLTEPVSKPFLRARLGEESGNLFDYEWAFPWHFTELGDEPGAYVPVPFQPQTNEDHLDATRLVDLVRAANRTPDPVFAEEMQGRMDVERFLVYLAVENAVAESDGFLGRFGVNNLYLYERGAGTFVILPWDKDTSFASPTRSVWEGVPENVLARRLLSDERLRARYVSALRTAAGSYVNTRWLQPQLEEAYLQIRDAALQDAAKPWTNAQFEDAVAGLRGVIAAREADVAAQLGPAQ